MSIYSYTCPICGKNFTTSYRKNSPNCGSCNSRISANKQWAGNDVRRAQNSSRFKVNNPGIKKGEPSPRKGKKNKNPYPMSEAVLQRLEHQRQNPSPALFSTGETFVDKYGEERAAEIYDKMSDSAIKLIDEGRKVLRVSYKGKYKPKHPEKYRGNPSQIVFRSSWEYSLMKRFDLDPNILEWRSEEIVIPYLYTIDGRMHRYFPDFAVKVKKEDGSIEELIIEVKPKGQTEPPKEPKRKTKSYYSKVYEYVKNQDKWKAANKWAAQHNMKFVVLTEDEIFGK